ncbi:hypothetical protein JTB14_034571 [Gonioctena quinquepunctata]|nr:hypothetical protein JTB14_034571 [Gonioctena quinquepunctata]
MSETFKMSKSVPAESRGSRSRGSRTTSKTKKSDSKRHQAELEFALEKKKLEQEEFRRKQEMLDIELALKLSELEDEELCSEKRWPTFEKAPLGQLFEIKNKWQTTNVIRYEDDTVIPSDNVEGLPVLLDRIHGVEEEWGVKIKPNFRSAAVTHIQMQCSN